MLARPHSCQVWVDKQFGGIRAAFKKMDAARLVELMGVNRVIRQKGRL